MERFLLKRKGHVIWGGVLFFFLTFSPLVWGNPQGGQVVSGSATINQTNPAVTAINQLTNQAIINWNSFGIGPNQLVQFNQPSVMSAILNRVTGVDPSLILGTLRANGNVFLINPNGILFGPNSVVNVGGLLASTLNISDQDFLNGNYHFIQLANQPNSFVVNQGSITTTPGGFVVFLGPLVDNEGKIAAQLGSVNLAGTKEAVVNFDGLGYVNVVLGEGYQKNGKNGNSKNLETHRNSFGNGEFPANASSTSENDNVSIIPQAITPLLQQVASGSGIVEADSVTEKSGTVVLNGASGLAINGGTIETNGEANANAGNVTINSAQETILLPGSAITANGAGSNSNGGNIHILSNGNTLFSPDALLQATGGTSGNGGFIEVSGKGNVGIFGNADTSAPNGLMGMFLIDPTNLTITDTGAGTGDQDTKLPSILYSTLDTTNNTVSVGTLQAQTSNITLQASSSITINDLTSAPGNGSLTLQPNVSLTMQTQTGNITFNNTANSIVTSGTGAITIQAGQSSGAIGTATLGNLTTANQNVTLSAAGNLSFGKIAAGTGTVSLTSTQGSVSGTSVSATKLLAKAATGIGTSGTPIATTVSNLQADNTTSNGIYINNTGNLTIDDFSLGTSTGIENDGTGGITINNSGSVDLPGNFTSNPTNYRVGLYAPNGGNITLNATGASSNITSCDGVSCTSANGGMSTADSHGGNVTLTAVGNIDLGVNAFADVHTNFGSSNSGSISLTGNNITIDKGSYIESNTGSVTLSATNALAVTNGSSIFSNSTGNVSLSSGSGGITVDSLSNVYSSNTGNVSLTATGGTLSLASSVYSNGNVTASAVNIVNNSGSLSQPLFVSYGGNVSLTASGSGGIGTVTAPIRIQTTSLSATTTSANAPIYLDDSPDSLTGFSITTNNGSVGISAADVLGQITFAGGSGGSDQLNAQFTSALSSFSFDNTGGNIILNSAINAGTGTATLTASGYIANNASPVNITANTLNLSAATGIGWNGSISSNIDTSATSLTATTTTLNTAQINVADSASLSSLSVTTNNSPVTITAANATGSISLAGGSGGTDLLNAQFTGSTLTSFSFDNTGGNLVLDSAHLVNMGGNASSAATLTASGYIANGASTGSITANTLNLSAATGIGWNGSISSSIGSNATSLTAATTTLNTAQINLADSASLSSLSVTTDNSPVAITAANATGSISLAGGSGGTDLLNAQFTGSALTNFSFDNTGGNVVLDSAHLVNMGGNASSAATLTASGYIANGASTGSITANTLNLSAATGIGWNGSVASSIGSSATSLTAATTTLNTAQINLADTTSLAALSVTTNNSSVAITASNISAFSFGGGSGGNDKLNARFTGSTLSTFSFNNTGGNINFDNNNYVNLGAGTTTGTLTASGSIAINGGAPTDAVTATTANITAGTYIGASSSNITTAISTLNATASNGGIYISNTGPGNLSIAGATASGSGNNVTISNSAGNLNINGTMSGAVVTLTTTKAGTGAIADPGAATVTGTTSITLNSIDGIGTNTQYLLTNTPSITAVTTVANTAPIYISDSGSLSSLSLTTVNSSVGITASNASGSISLAGGSGGTDLLNAQFISPLSTFTLNNTTGNFTFNATNVINAGIGSVVTLIAASGNIASSSSTPANITAQKLILQAANGIGSSLNPLTTAVSQLTAYNTASGDIVITNTGSLTVDDYYFGQGFGIENKAANGAITITNSGTIDAPFTLASPGHCLGIDCTQGGINNTGIGFYDPNGGNITLNATGATSDIIAADTNYGEIAEADGGNVSLTAGEDIALGNGSNLQWADTYTFTGNGSITFNAGRNLIVTGYTTIESNSGNINFTAGSAIESTANNAIGTGNKIIYSGTTAPCCGGTSGTGNINFTAGTSISTANISTAGNVTLSATSGSVTDSTGGAANCATAGGACDVVAGTLTSSAGTYIGASGSSFYTRISNLNATASNGGIYVSNRGGASGLTITKASAANGAISISNGTSGNVSITGAASATGSGNNVTISNSAGNVDVGSGGSVSGAAVTLTTTKGGSGVITDTGAGTVTGTTSVTLNSINGIGTNTQYLLTNTPSITAVTTQNNNAPIYINNNNNPLASLSITTANSTPTIIGVSNMTAFSFGGGKGGTDLLNAQFSGSNLTNFSFDNTNGNIVLDSSHLINPGSGTTTATLTASGDIANGTSAGSITATNATLTAGTYIGTSSSNISTAFSALNATASNGGIYISNSTSGNLSITGASASGGGNTITISNSAGNIDIGGAITGGAVTFTTTNAANGSITDSSLSTVSGTTSLTLNAITGIGTSSQKILAVTPSITAVTTVANNAPIYITDSDTSGSPLSNLSVTTNNSTTSIVSSYGSLSFSGGIGGTDLFNVQYTNNGKVLSTFSFDNTGGNIAFDSSDTMNIVKGTTASLTASGSITENGTSTAITYSSGTLTLSAGTNIGADATTGDAPFVNPPPADDQPIYTTVATLNASGTGVLDIDNSRNLTIGTVTGFTDTDVIANGSVKLDGFNVPNGSVNLIATGDITDITGGTETDIIAQSAYLQAGGVIGTAGAPVTVSIVGGSLTATAGGSLSGTSISLSGTIPANSTFNAPGGILVNDVAPVQSNPAAPIQSNPTTPIQSNPIPPIQSSPTTPIQSNLFYFTAVSQDNPYLSNVPGPLSTMLLQPLDAEALLQGVQIQINPMPEKKKKKAAR